MVYEEIAEFLLGAGDENARAFALHHAGIADLTAGLTVERRLVENYEAGLARLQLLHFLAVLEQGHDDAFGILGIVAEELGRAGALLHGKPHILRRRLPRAGPGRTGLLALALHSGVEGVRIDADAARLQGILRQVEREAVGVVERESRVAREVLALGEAAGFLVEDSEAALQGLAEAGFLQFQRLRDERL